MRQEAAHEIIAMTNFVSTLEFVNPQEVNGMTGKLSRSLDQNRDPVHGNAQARIKLIWYADYSARISPTVLAIMPRVFERCGPENIALTIRQLPSLHRAPESVTAACAAIAAHRQDRFFAMHDALSAHDGRFDEAAVGNLARALNLDMKRFSEDLTSPETLARIKEDRVDAERVGGAMTPLLFIDNQLYEGAWDEETLFEALEKPLGVRLGTAGSAFFNWAASAGLVLVLATLAALLVANLGGHAEYEHIRETPLGLSFGERSFVLPLEAWINDGLMALFFLLVGIEIKREIIDGELSDLSRAALPVFGALGGMIAPALIFAALNWGKETIVGWGVPMATDIAFTLGLMALLGSRVSTSLKVFVSALAIADDLGAILVIAVFFGQGINVHALIYAAFILAAMIALNKGRVYSRTPYLLLGIGLWFFVHESGLHATLAGVLTAFAIPSRRKGDIDGVSAQTRAIFDAELRKMSANTEFTIGSSTLKMLNSATDRLRDPGFHLQHAMESWSSFLILPLFAFFNTGILLCGSSFQFDAPETLGVMMGLVIGKPLGIMVACGLATALGLAKLSPDLRWSQMLGASCLAGVGFTMSIFIGSAAFSGDQLAAVKLAVLIGSLLSAVLGVAILYVSGRKYFNPQGE